MIGPLLAGFTPSHLGAQSGNAPDSRSTVVGAPLTAAAMHRAAPTVEAIPLSRPIEIDGVLGERDWQNAPAATRFTQTEPNDGAAPTQHTDVRILYDDDAIYVGARLSDSSGHIASRLGRRDNDLPDSDWFTVVFDSYHNHTGGFRFKVNPAGIVGDEANGDRSWNPVWTAATSIDGDGWTVEMRIPFSQLRFTSADEQLWGVQFYRDIRASAEKLSFSYSPRSESGGPSRFGHLTGIHDIKRGKVLEILPFVSAREELRQVPVAENTSFRNPFRSGRDFYPQIGADIKYRLTSNFTLDATINPDFGQIEADEQQVNLSANEQFFREQRPFFVEGGDTFRFGNSIGGGGGGQAQIFYTRRVGRSPQGSLPGASRYSNMPTQSAILGAAKLTGRTSNGWSVGIAEALTAREVAPWVDSAAHRFNSEVEPLSNYFTARVSKDLRAGQSKLGGIFTSVQRGLSDSTLTSRLRSSAYVGGFDFGHRFGNQAWEISGSMAGSRIAGSTPVLTAAQRSSVRFYQRPDAEYLRVDSTATTLAGWSGALNLDKHNGAHWTGELHTSFVSPGYEINDLGFQNNADRISLNSSLNYDERNPGTHLRNWGITMRSDLRANFGGDITQKTLRGDANVQLLNFIGGRLNYSHDFTSLDDRLTRGGPLALSVPVNDVSINLNGDSRRKFTWSLFASERQDASGGWRQNRNVKVGYRPTSWLTGEIGPNYSRGRTTAQYVASVADPLAVGTYGRRYIFSGIDQNTLSMQTRLNLTMSPTLSVSMVAEPFIASGHYDSPEELRAPRTFAFNRYGTDIGTVVRNADSRLYQIDPDGAGPAGAFTVSDRSFNTRSINATANLRWEWRPGSTLFVVWQHRRANPASYGDFRFGRDFYDIFSARSENTLMFKVNYWLNP